MVNMVSKKGMMVVFVVMGMAMMLPLQAFSAVCFRSASVADPTKLDDIKVTVSGPQTEEFFSLVGEAIRGSCLPTQRESAPLVGAARIRADGAAYISLFIGGTASCRPVVIHGKLFPPGFNSGTGMIDNPSLNTRESVNFFPIPCPVLP